MSEAASTDPRGVHLDIADARDARDARAAAGGDRVAFARLYERHARRIHSLARRMLGAGEADDATQDVFFRIWEKLPLYQPDAPFGGWARRLAVNVILRRREELSRPLRQGSSAEVDALQAPAPRPDARMDLAAALAALHPEWRDVVVLHDMEGYRHEEIAELLDISVGSSRMRLHRARALLREALS